VEIDLLDSWERHLLAKNRSTATVHAYLTDARTFGRWLGHDVTNTRQADVEGFLAANAREGLAAATVARRYRSLRQLYRWLADEGEIAASPMARMSPPSVPIQPPPIIPDDELRALLYVCGGKRFEDRRDRALILMLATTGVRAGEIMGLSLDDVDLKRATFTVLGKGRRHRLVELLPVTAEAVDRYIRTRRTHPFHQSSMLWLGAKGGLSVSGLGQMLERRCTSAGIKPINPHRFRHTFAHRAKALGMSDGDLMAIAGWQSPQMLHRYGASAAAERARAAHRRIFEGEEP
jgi:site-specific recombinase XerD